MSKEIKNRFRCKLCKEVYPITTDMLRDVYAITGFGHKEFAKAFNCPICGNIYVNYGDDSRWTHSVAEFFNAHKNEHDELPKRKHTYDDLRKRKNYDQRLTERFSNGQAAVAGCGSKCEYNYEYCDLNNNDCPTLNAIFEKLAFYEDIEEKEN